MDTVRVSTLKASVNTLSLSHAEPALEQLGVVVLLKRENCQELCETSDYNRACTHGRVRHVSYAVCIPRALHPHINL